MAFVLCLTMTVCANGALNETQLEPDIIIFSYDRPLQLHAFLESLQRYVTGIKKAYVIYRISDCHFGNAYNDLKVAFPEVVFVQQKEAKQADFKSLLLQLAFRQSNSRYILFAVDDIIVTDFCNLCECTRALEKYAAYGFFLRLGKNIKQAYMQSISTDQPQPPLKQAQVGMYAWQFNKGCYSWGYPNTVDMTIYRKDDIKKCFAEMVYKNPSGLEAQWAFPKPAKNQQLLKAIKAKIGLCYEHSKVVNLPLNLVQELFAGNKHAQAWSTKELLKRYNEGYCFDIAPLYKINNKSPHMPYLPSFIKRVARGA